MLSKGIQLTSQWPWRSVLVPVTTAPGTDHPALRVAKNYTKGYTDTQVSYEFLLVLGG